VLCPVALLCLYVFPPTVRLPHDQAVTPTWWTRWVVADLATMLRLYYSRFLACSGWLCWLKPTQSSSSSHRFELLDALIARRSPLPYAPDPSCSVSALPVASGRTLSASRLRCRLDHVIYHPYHPRVSEVRRGGPPRGILRPCLPALHAGAAQP